MALEPTEAVEFMRQVMDADSENRQLGLTDLKFRFGDQWPQYAIASRGLDRPQLTINEMDSYIRQVTNAQRQQRPRIKVQPVDNFADPKVAKVITGMIRHIEVNSNADHAYDTAFDFAATMGWGYWRLRADYIADDSFNQDLFIDCIDNPFTVYFDPASKLPDGSDAEKALITDMMRKKAFEKQYPGANPNSFSERGTGDSDPDWDTEHEIRVAEYFYTKRESQKLVMLSDNTPVWADMVPPEEILRQAGIRIIGDRDSQRRTVHWCKQTSMEVLEEKKLPGRWIPVIPVYWTNVIIDGQRVKQGLVRPGMDPQRMVNFWQTSITESIALGPKPKWIMAEGQDEGHENEWKNANLSPLPRLVYKQTDVKGQPAPPPQRVAPEPPPAGMIEASMLANQNLQRVMGMFDPATRSQNDKSGRAIIAERSQSENSNYHGYDNLTRSMKHTGRIILSWIPTYFDTKRVQRIIGEDGTDSLVTLNEPKFTDEDAIAKVLNDVRVGTYDVVMETGPGYDTKRIEGVASMLQLMATPIGEKVAQVGDDILVRQMDFPQSDILADRLAAANPLAQIDEKLDIPPKIQMAIKQLQGQNQSLTQVVQQLQQQLKSRSDVAEIREHGAILRERMKQDGDKEERAITRAQKQHDTEVYGLTAQNVAEINALARILTSHTEHGNRLREMLIAFQTDAALQDRQLLAKSEETEPTVQ